MSGARSVVNDIDIDLGQLFGALWRSWVRIICFALIVTAGAFLIATLATPQYRAETRILIEARESPFTRPTNAVADSDRPLLDEEAITSQVEVISSADILRDVARQLNLSERAEFSGSSNSILSKLMVMTGLRRDPSQASLDERVLKEMRERLTVFRVERSRVIVVRFASEDPELAAEVPNRIAAAYLKVQEDAKLASNVGAAQWLEPEIADLSQRVREAEEKVAAYRAQADLFMGQGTAGLATQQLSELATELSRVRVARSAAESRASAVRDALRSGAQVEAMPEVLNAPLVERLRERHAQLSAELADLSTSLLGSHPRIRALNAQISETNQQLRGEMQKVLRSLESEAGAAQAQEQQLLANVNTLKAKTARAEGDEVELRALEREAAAQRALLEAYLTRHREAAARSDRTYLPADARVFARASAPFEPYFPKVLPITVAAFIGSLLLAVIGILLAELFSGRAMRPTHGSPLTPVRQVPMPPVPSRDPEPTGSSYAPTGASAAHYAEAALADTPSDPEQAPVLPAAAATEQPIQMSIEMVASHLVSSGTIRAIFVSPEGDEAGASSVMVAREIADVGLRVVLLDLTWGGAPSTAMLQSAAYAGITDLLASEAQFADVIHGDLYSDCHVIPVGTADRNRAMKAADRLPIIMASLATAYDIVVVECGPAAAEGIARVDGEACTVVLSLIEPDNAAVLQAVIDLERYGYADLIRVTPKGYLTPPKPRGRSAA